ncbi:MAG TPA: FemAB family XrtA/PEP-CTERM system-associated protein [Stellaceae bacterium]|nr:FemAB family XrtA/PEP-CTERM system-associated protein [Stellaceae bacterium]
MDGSQVTVAVRPFRVGDEHRWDEFVLAHASGTFFHLSGWKRVIERAFGHRTYYLIAERGQTVTGVLPLTHVQSLLFGSSLISNAFSVHGGPIAEDAKSLRKLEAEALRLMDAIAVPVLELRNFSASRADWPSRKDLYASFRRSLDPAVEHNMKSIPRKQRAMIRKGMLNKLKSEIDDSIERLYRIYAESAHNLGTPVFSKSYFGILREEFPTCSDIITITCDGQAVASVLNFYFRDEVLPFYGGGVRAARTLAANDFMYWEVMRRACERGYRTFDFGRSKIGTGSYAFKRNWGFQPTPLVYQFCLSPGTAIPDLNPLNPKLRMLIAVWKRLPRAVVTRLGPAIVRGIG